jgi:hypothetical protein
VETEAVPNTIARASTFRPRADKTATSRPEAEVDRPVAAATTSGTAADRAIKPFTDRHRPEVKTVAGRYNNSSSSSSIPKDETIEITIRRRPTRLTSRRRPPTQVKIFHSSLVCFNCL